MNSEILRPIDEAEKNRPAAPDSAAPPSASAAQPAEPTEDATRRLLPMSLAALGVVYGDIGTSPLYAFREAMAATSPAPKHVLGVLSMIFWSLMLVVSLKYLALVMRADNRGEGGILALLALLNPWRGDSRRRTAVLIGLGVFGAALLYGDGMITPAISVLSAVEGLESTAHGIDRYILPITIAILVLLFAGQRHGTGKIGALFGPVILVWFIVLAALGVIHIVQQPGVLYALAPWHAVAFLADSGTTAAAVLGAVFLVVTGSEALYADMGHFGRRPIRLAWFALVLPCLVLNYFGQGALVLGDPALAKQPFYMMAPQWALYPLIGLATVSTIIASQAVISGAFSLTRQAVQLGQCPRMNIVQTSSEEAGQVFVPAVNAALAVATIGLVLGFGSSANLAAAYGVAVSTTMVITTVLAYAVMRQCWGWSVPLAAAIAAPLFALDLAFLGANGLKIFDGGWFPLLVGGSVFLLMTTWHRGRTLLLRQLRQDIRPFETFLARLVLAPPQRVPGTAVFVTASIDGTPPILLHHLEHNQVLHERVILVSVATEQVPRVSASERISVEELSQGFCRMQLHYGFMQMPNLPVALRLAAEAGLQIDLERITYYLARETLIPSMKIPGMALWREKLFIFMSRNTSSANAFYRIPPERVIELGMQVEI